MERSRWMLTFRIEKSWDTKVVLSNRKSPLQIGSVGVLPKLSHVDQFWTNRVNNSNKGMAIPPTGAEIFNLHTETPKKKKDGSKCIRHCYA